MKSEYQNKASLDNLPDNRTSQEDDNKIELFDVVALTHDLPEFNLRRGLVGTVVEILSNGDAYEVEFSDREGRTYESLGFRASQLLVLHYAPIQKPAVSTNA